MKKIAAVITATAVASALSACSIKSGEPEASPEPTKKPMSEELINLTQNTVNAVITLEDGEEINLELYPDLAPETVENFIDLADEGFYDDTIFHRVIDGFVIQGGGYDEDLNSLKADTIYGEFSSNGFDNELSHERGVISMARVANDPDSASSQFFIMVEDAAELDGDYAAFGRVADDESMEVVDEIASVKTGTVSNAGLEDVPVSPVIIKSITISSSLSSSVTVGGDEENSSKHSSGKKTSGTSDAFDEDSNDSSGSSFDKDSDSSVGDNSSSSSKSGSSKNSKSDDASDSGSSKSTSTPSDDNSDAQAFEDFFNSLDDNTQSS